jgi:hypothetical protein
MQKRFGGLDHWEYEYAATFYPFPNDQCNYSCKYCTTRKLSRGATPVPIDDAKRFWWNLRRSRGIVRVSVSGAEPTQDMSLISMLSAVHYVNLSTNLSFDAMRAVNTWKKSSIIICASYHPGMTTLNEFISNLVVLQGHGFHISTVSAVDFPDYRDDVDRMVECVGELEIPTVIHRLIGGDEDYNPSNHVVDNERIVTDHDPSVKCLAGCKYFSVDSYGAVYRCYKVDRIGDIYNGFKLTDLASACGHEDCSCLSIRNKLVMHKEEY